MIFDAHTHITRVGSLSFVWADLNYWLTRGRKCVVLPKITQFCDSVLYNIVFFDRYKMENILKQGDIYPFAWIHPRQLEDGHFHRFPMAGFKFHPSITQETVADSTGMIRLCGKYKKPLLIHCGRGEKSRIDHVLRVNEEFSNVNFICAHMGGLATDLVVRALKLLKENRNTIDNIYLDTSGCYHPKLIVKAIGIIGADHVIFATDRPYHTYEISRYVIECCKLSNETKRLILEDNILKLLG